VAQNEMVVMDRVQAIRRQEKQLKHCKTLIDQIEGGGDDEGLAKNLVGELQVIYDKYQ